MKSKILLPFLSAISVIALLLAGCPPTNGGGGDTAPQYKSIQLVGKTIEIIFDKDLKGTPDAAKITVKQGTTTLTITKGYTLSISSTDKKKLIITLKQTPTSGQTYTATLKAGAVTGANGKAAKAKVASLEVNPAPVLLSSGNLGFQTNSSTVLTLSFDTALKSLDTTGIKVQAKAAKAGAKFGGVPATLKLNKDDKTKIDITLKTAAASGSSYKVVVAIGGVVSADNVANSTELTSIAVKYSDKPVLDTINPPYILGKKLIATFNMNIDLLAENKVKLSKAANAVAAVADTFTALTPESVKVGENKTNTLEITFPAMDTVATGNVYRIALEAGAVNKAGKADITNPAIKPTDMTILAAPALDGSQAPYMVGDKIYVTFNSPIPGLDTSKKIGVEVSTDDGANFEASDDLDAPPTFSGTVLALTLDSRTLNSTYKVTLPAGLILGRNTLLTGNIELDIKATAGPSLVSGTKPVFQSETVFHITFNANVSLLNADTIEVRKGDTAVPTTTRNLAADGSTDTVVVTLTEGATVGSKWKVLFPVGTVLDATSRNANPGAITTAEETFVDIYRPANKAELKAAIITEQKKTTPDFSTDKFDISRVSDMSELFKDNITFNGDISSWDVSHVTNMTRMFQGATAFNQALEDWAVDGDTVDIKEMFKDSGVEPANIPSWYIKITPKKSILYILKDDIAISPLTFTRRPANMTGTFGIKPELPYGLSLSSTTGEISGKPTVTSATTHTITFTGSDEGSGDFSGSKYNTSIKLPIEVSGYKHTPAGASSAAVRRNLKKLIDDEITTQGTESPYLNYIDVSGVKWFFALFQGKNQFNGDISKWDTGSGVLMTAMFNKASAFNGDISKWDTSSVVVMELMFNKATSFNQDISEWDVSNVKNMESMFNGASAFDNGGQALDWGTKTGKVTSMQRMFDKATAFNQDISGWDVSQVTKMRKMFFGAKAFNQDISRWDVGKVTDMEDMFNGATAFSYNLEAWATRLSGRTVKKTDVFKNSGVTQANKPSWYTWHTRRK